MIPWWRTDVGTAEIRAVEEAILNRHVNQGALCAEFERRLAERLGVPYVVTCTNGSAALYMALCACEVHPGDEVIVPAISFIATAHAVMLRNATVRLVDVHPDRPLIDARLIESAVNDRTRVIIAVHLNGAACDMQAINAIAKRHHLKVIEDTAQAFTSIDSHGDMLGTMGDVGTFSMSIAKLMTTGEGGFVATKDSRIYEQLLRARNQGVLEIRNNVFDQFGFNFRFNDMLAAVGLAQLASLPHKISAVRGIYEFYRDGIRDLRFLNMMPCQLQTGEVPLWSQVLCSDRERVVELLQERGIQTRPVNPPLCESPHLCSMGDYPNARRLAANLLGLPSGPNQKTEDLSQVMHALHEISDQISERCRLSDEGANARS